MNDKILDRAMKKYRNHGSRYFGKEELPTELANEKNTAEQIRMCFDAYENPQSKVLSD